ncbi:RNA polymerase subunit sigma-70 [Dactylosporangium sp. CS-047395]|uniref:RNA polymerase subunit sigma-70 n=1 Tax=Dactylosporangium sp. CS-047395 TaxID=3239936 RepID=UPI003D8ABFAB
MSLLERARAGDDSAFGELVEPFRRELYVHCYRMLGSVQDAEDVLQETLTAAWRGLGSFAERASVRTWLYRIATNRCLNWLRDGERRPRTVPGDLGAHAPAPTRTVEPVWLQPIPDALLAGLPDDAPGPEARYERREAVSLAFVTAVQGLPPRQRAVLLLRDVLGFRAAETAGMLELTEDAANALLKRARAVDFDRAAAAPASPRQLVAAGRFADALEAGDVDAMVALLTDDAWLTMPPAPLEYQGRAAIGAFIRHVGLRDGRRRYRLVPTGANGQPAFGCYVSDDGDPVAHALGTLVLTMRDERVAVFTRFLDNAVLPYFGLPRSL